MLGTAVIFALLPEQKSQQNHLLTRGALRFSAAAQE
jgi:hypothetical protein